MEVISGAFNAEYGQAMSGVVNIVTQEGAQAFHGSRHWLCRRFLHLARSIR